MSVSITPVVSTDMTYTREFMEQTTPDAMEYALNLYAAYHKRLDAREWLLGDPYPVDDRLGLEQYLAEATGSLPDDLLNGIIAHAQKAIADAEPAVHEPPYRCADSYCVVTRYADGRVICERHGKPSLCYLRAKQLLRLYGRVRDRRVAAAE